MGRAKDSAAWEFLNDCLEQADPIKRLYEPKWHENYANYRVEPFYGTGTGDKRYPLASNAIGRLEMSPVNYLKSPESHQGVNTLRALLLSSLFGAREYVQADPNGDEDIDAAKKVSRLVMYGLERPGNFRTNFELLGDAVTMGLGSYSARWKRIDKVVPRRFPVPHPDNPFDFLRNPQTGSIMTVLKNVKVPVFDDPVIETDEIFETWFDPAANRFDQLNWKLKMFRIRDVELEALKADPNAQQNGYDLEGIDLVLNTIPDSKSMGLGKTTSPKLKIENITDEDVKDIEKYGYYTGWQLEGVVDPDTCMALGLDPDSTNVIRMVNGFNIQSTMSSQRMGKIQGGVFTILPTGRGIYGLSPLTVVRYLQDISDTQLILTVQSLIEAAYQNYLIDGNQGPNFARLLETRRPREVLTAQGDIEQIRPLPRDYTGLQIAMEALTMMSQTMRNAMNARDPVQGIQKQSGETTATESQIVATSALQNADQLAVLIERDELPIMGNLINDLYYVNLDDEGKVFRRIGEEYTTSVSYFDIDNVTDITFMGARSLLSRQGKSNQFRDFASIMASNPLTLAMTDWEGLVRRWGDEGFELKGLDQLIIKDPQEIVARMQSMGLANTMGPPQGGGPGVGGGAPGTKPRSNPANGGGRGAINPAQAAGEPSWAG